jgi:predicted nuclease of restriction endonuclease-like (RecB) superfamily
VNKEEQIYNQIKDNVIDIVINKKTSEYINNRYDLSKYYEIGKLIVKVQEKKDKNYGSMIIKNFSHRLNNELKTNISVKSLYRYREYYLLCIENEIFSTLSRNLSWSHICEVLYFGNINKMIYYLNKAINNCLSIRKLRELIKSHDYERLPEDIRNKIVNNEKMSIMDEFKNPIILSSKELDKDIISEKVLHNLIIKDLDNFLLQLGNGYTYVGHEYPIKLGNTNNYIDILLFNIKYNCYVVVELKVTELKKDHIGQIQVYMNYIDQNIKQFNHDKTIGLIVVRRNNEYIIRYSSDDRIKCVEWSM